MKKPLSLAHWQRAAADVLSVLCTEQYVTDGDNYFNRLWHEAGLDRSHFPAGAARDLFDAVATLHEAGRPVNWNSVADVALATVTEATFTELVTLADPTRMGRVFDDNLALLRRYGEAYAAMDAMRDTTAALLAGGDTTAEVDTLISTLSRGGSHPLVDVTAAASAERFEQFMHAEPLPARTSGMDWLDGYTNGLPTARLFYLAGPYKSSKTRIAYNMALAAAEQGVSVAILSRENPERVITAQLVAMLAARWLLARGVPYAPSQPVWWISPDHLLAAQRTAFAWQPEVKARAVREGLARFKALEQRLRIYDSAPSHGKLSDMPSIRRVIQRDKRLYGGTLFLIDHLGLIKRAGSIYEKTAANSNDLQALSREDDQHPITLVVLAQLNEATIKQGADYSAGVKGGGDPSADADVVLTTKPLQVDGTYANDRTELTVKLNRWGASGASKVVFFHPDSGLILTDEQAGKAGLR